MTIQRTPTLNDGSGDYRLVFYRYEQPDMEPKPWQIPADAQLASSSNLSGVQNWTFVLRITPDHHSWKSSDSLPVVQMPGGGR